MSWVRFGSPCVRDCEPCPGSDVYVFDNTDGYIECCGCLLRPRREFWFKTEAEMLAHLREHAAAGHHVPAYFLATPASDDSAPTAPTREGGT